LEELGLVIVRVVSGKELLRIGGWVHELLELVERRSGLRSSGEEIVGREGLSRVVWMDMRGKSSLRLGKEPEIGLFLREWVHFFLLIDIY